MTSRPVTAVAVLLLAACAAPGANAGEEGEPPADRSGVPVIENVTPASGRAGESYPITVTITGGPFDATGNVVLFGRWRVGPIASSDGRTLEVSLPKSIRTAPEVAPMVIQPGTYPIVVETSEGATEPFDFTLTEGGRG